MLPKNNTYLDVLGDLTVTEGEDADAPTLTWSDENAEAKQIDGRKALAEAVARMLKTDRGKYAIYSADYGLPYDNYIGKPRQITYVNLATDIREMLMRDKRITDVHSFTFDVAGGKTLRSGVLNCEFTIQTIYGEVVLDV